MLTSLCNRKQIMVRFMAFSGKTGSIDRCLGLDISAPAPSGFAGLLARLSLQLKIISPRKCLAFVLLSLFYSLSAIWLPVSMCPLHINELIWTFGDRGGEVEGDRAGMVNPVMQKPDPAGPYCEAACRNNIKTSVQRATPNSYLPIYTLSYQAAHEQGDVWVWI